MITRDQVDHDDLPVPELSRGRNLLKQIHGNHFEIIHILFCWLLQDFAFSAGRCAPIWHINDDQKQQNPAAFPKHFAGENQIFLFSLL